MSGAAIAAILLLAAVQVLAAYISRVYAEFGKIMPREVQEDLDAWEELVEPRLGLKREHAALCASILQQISLGLIALAIGFLLFDHESGLAWPSAAEIVQAAIGLLLVVAFCSQIIPSLLFNRTHGRWVRRWLWLIRVLLWLMTPVSFLVHFFFSVASLTEPPVNEEDEDAPDVESLLEAGEEEGILEESDRELVRSAVEFGDKLVREVMTPRPDVYAVRDTMTLEEFVAALAENKHSRVPVYSGTLDNITGIAFAHDLLQISDEEAHTRTVASIQREAAFVPETKNGYELLREMQREKQHLRIVIDEYGGVAGVVAIEDLLEEIVGEIPNEHGDEEDGEKPQRQTDGSWIVEGGFEVDQLADLFGESIAFGEEYEATTVGGLVCEIEGRIPLAGEVVMLEEVGVRVEVLASSDRLVERVRVFPPVKTARE
jgi:putative hemolysin